MKAVAKITPATRPNLLSLSQKRKSARTCSKVLPDEEDNMRYPQEWDSLRETWEGDGCGGTMSIKGYDEEHEARLTEKRRSEDNEHHRLILVVGCKGDGDH